VRQNFGPEFCAADGKFEAGCGGCDHSQQSRGAHVEGTGLQDEEAGRLRALQTDLEVLGDRLRTQGLELAEVQRQIDRTIGQRESPATDPPNHSE
jgi:hypothetical protein